MKKFIVNCLKKILNNFEPKMNDKYRKIFTIIGVVWGMLIYFVQDVPAQIIKLSIIESDKYIINSINLFSQTLIYGFGLFVFYTAVSSTLFIVSGEIFIRVCEYFNIKSKLYLYMVKVKDTTMMNSIEYYEKYGRDELNKKEQENK